MDREVLAYGLLNLLMLCPFDEMNCIDVAMWCPTIWEGERGVKECISLCSRCNCDIAIQMQ